MTRDIKKLSFVDKRTLSLALLECPHFKEQERRKLVIKEFDEECHSIKKTSLGALNINTNDQNSCALMLVNTWRDWDTFNIYITVAEYYDCGTDSLNKLIEIGGKIFDPSPDPRILIKESNKWIITINDDEFCEIPTSISMSLDENDLLSAIEFNLTWKGIHTLCDDFLKKYIFLYKHIISGDAQNVLEKLNSFEKDCNDFCTGLDSLTHQNVFSPEFEPIFHLKKIRRCTMPLRETIGNGEGTTYFKLGQEFAEYIMTQLVLQSLSMADRILSISIA